MRTKQSNLFVARTTHLRGVPSLCVFAWVLEGNYKSAHMLVTLSLYCLLFVIPQQSLNMMTTMFLAFLIASSFAQIADYNSCSIGMNCTSTNCDNGVCCPLNVSCGPVRFVFVSSGVPRQTLPSSPQQITSVLCALHRKHAVRLVLKLVAARRRRVRPFP